MLAARTVLRLAQGEKIESPRVELATELVVRDSTAARALSLTRLSRTRGRIAFTMKKFSAVHRSTGTY